MNNIYLLIRECNGVDEMTCILGSYSSRENAEAAKVVYRNNNPDEAILFKIEPISVDKPPRLELYL